MLKFREADKGFTLIEMSIVLVIIGLIVGAIILGTSLIRQAQLMSISTNVQAYTSAVQTFMQKYNDLPGDMANATSYWGTNPNCATQGVGAGTQTCNGNGDGQIGNPQLNRIEGMYFWQHLGNAGLINGNFSGATTNMASGGWDQIGYNCPASKVDGAGFSMLYLGTATADGAGIWSSLYQANYKHVFEFGAQDYVYHGDPWVPVITAGEAFNIDTKFDDGMPGTGNIMVQNPNADNCATNYNHTTAQYNMGTQSYSCQLLFITGF